ncbi:MAG: hypothetical protein OXH06_14640 [Gemmatimonadetes bacterium]|nr:hypothetical protein [Gemmatimonadota bacterium]
MNPTLALFWKEGREAAYKIAAGAGLAFVVGLVCARAEGTLSGGTEVQIMSHLVGLFGAVLMGMDFISRERSRMTLPFLLCRPLDTWKILVVQFTVGAAGLAVVVAAFWFSVFLGMPETGIFLLRTGYFQDIDLSARTYFPWQEILADVGFIRVWLLWFSFYLVPYSWAVIASTLTDHPLKTALTSLMSVWIAFVLILVGRIWAPDIAVFYFRLLSVPDIVADEEIVRLALDTSLLFASSGVAILLACGSLLCACRVFRVQASGRFQWVVGALAIVGAIAVIGLDDPTSPRGIAKPVGNLQYKSNTADMALDDGLAVVLLKRGLSVVDVTDPLGPSEVGRIERNDWRFERLALYGPRAYVWGEVRDSAGVAVFDLSQPDRPLLQAPSLFHPIAKGPTPWLRRVPRLVGWGVWDGYLYVGLLHNEFLELHCFDVRKGGPPQRIQALRIEEVTKHAWNNGWGMRIVGPHVFLTLGHDFVVLDLSDPGASRELSRISLRRFGRAVHYEKMVEEFRRKMSPGGPGEHITHLEPDELQEYVVPAPPGLGPLSVGHNRAYIERHLPREIAVVDISDPRKPVEVDYIPWTHLPRGMTIAGESAYALLGGDIQTYVKTRYGTFSRREQQQLGTGVYSAYLRGLNRFDRKTLMNHLASDMFIVADDHIYALLNNHLAIFENPRKAE